MLQPAGVIEVSEPVSSMSRLGGGMTNPDE
jgi:hypothetical protein